ncbi:MAG TPA: hypothetical protein PKX28_03965, partial [Candidatus Hydrogenedentes bacterium]|nr:hypothetical protein [Candidatus Hydrogenedentota bacterium]
RAGIARGSFGASRLSGEGVSLGGRAGREGFLLTSFVERRRDEKYHGDDRALWDGILMCRVPG